ncbi:GAF domain-containing protein [Streptomyces sp. NPDC002520]
MEVDCHVLRWSVHPGRRRRAGDRNNVPLLRAAFRGPVAAHPVGEVSRLPDGTPFSRVLADLRPRLVPVELDSLWLPADPARTEAIARSDAHSLIVAPLALRGQAMGVVSFYRRGTEEPFEEEDIALTADVCAHAALCIDNARRYERERTIATTIKRRLQAVADREGRPFGRQSCGGVAHRVIALRQGKLLGHLLDPHGRSVGVVPPGLWAQPPT